MVSPRLAVPKLGHRRGTAQIPRAGGSTYAIHGAASVCNHSLLSVLLQVLSGDRE